MRTLLNPYNFAAVFAPPTPTAWWRSDFEVENGGLPAPNGGLVDFWGDMTGNGLDAVQATMAQQPTYNEAVINGHPALNFPRSTNQLMTVPSAGAALFPLVNLDFAFFAVLRPTNFTSPMVMLQRNSGSGSIQWYIATSGKQIWSCGSESAPSDTSLAVGAWNRIGLRVPTWGSGMNHYYLDGVLDGSPAQGVSGGAGASDLHLMGNPPAFVFPLIGDLAEFLFYDRDVTPAEVAQIDAYFVDRYAL